MAVALTQAGHEGKTHDITGPGALTHAEMASKLSEALGRHIRFIDIAEAAMRMRCTVSVSQNGRPTG